MNTSKRYIITVVSGVLLTGIAIISVLYRLEGVAMTCIGGIMTILTTYIWGETKRPSIKRNNKTLKKRSHPVDLEGARRNIQHLE